MIVIEIEKRTTIMIGTWIMIIIENDLVTMIKRGREGMINYMIMTE